MTNKYNSGAASFVAPFGDDEQRMRDAKPITAWSPASVAIVDAPDFQPPATATATIKGDYRDRAAAFNMRVAAMSTVSAAGLALMATAITSAPLLSLAALAWFGAGYLVTWLCAYALDAWLSPEGTAFLHTLRAWRWLDREQKHRHAVEWRERFPQDYER